MSDQEFLNRMKWLRYAVDKCIYVVDKASDLFTYPLPITVRRRNTIKKIEDATRHTPWEIVKEILVTVVGETLRRIFLPI